MPTDNQNDSLRLDQLLAALPREAAPSRDFWPEILDAVQKPAVRPSRSLFGQLAAGFVLVTVTATSTYFITRQNVIAEAQFEARAAVEANAIAGEYLRARAELDLLFAERVATLPPATRAKIEGDLADLRRAADELATTLAQHPSDPLLQDLLMSTRQRELRLLADISRIADPNS
jgi:hypothetical protein